MNQVPDPVHLAKLIEILNRRENFASIPSGNAHYDSFKNDFPLMNTLFNRLASFLKSGKNGVAKKELVMTILDPDGESAESLRKARNLFAYRNLWLPIEHITNCQLIGIQYPKMNEHTRRYLNAKDYTINNLRLDYDRLNDGTKKTMEIGFWYALLEDSLNDKGKKRLIEEEERYQAVLKILPEDYINTYANQITINDNPIDIVVALLKIYANDVTITSSETIEHLDV